MRTKPAAYLLIFLTIFASGDDALLAVAPVLPLQAEDEDNSEYVLTQREQGGQRLSRPARLPFVSLGPRGAGALDDQPVKAIPSESYLVDPFGPAPLYVFMSLQC